MISQPHRSTPRLHPQPYRGTLQIKNSAPPGPYSRTMPRALWWSYGGGAVSYERGTPVLAGERGWTSLNVLRDCRTENGSSQGQNLALIAILVPSSLDSGPSTTPHAAGPGDGVPCHSLSHSLSHSLPLSLFLTHTHTHSLSLTISLSLSLSHTHTRTHQHSHSHTHTHTHPHTQNRRGWRRCAR